MLLKIILALLILQSAVSAEIIETHHHNKKLLTEDIAILERMIKRKPGDSLALKRITKLSFALEQFNKTIVYSQLYLNKTKDKELAYLRIIALANLGNYQGAAREIDAFIKSYSLSTTEADLLEYKKQLYLKSPAPKAYPVGLSKLTNGNNISLRSVLYRENTLFGYNHDTRMPFFAAMGSALIPLKTNPRSVDGLDLSTVAYLSQSTNGRAILASVNYGSSSAILYRYYRPKDQEWSSWREISELNPGKNNGYANFIPNSDSVLFCSDTDDNSGYDIYLVHRNKSGDWGKPHKLDNINTRLNERSLSIHPDGKTIYFSSNGRPGFGGYDLFSAQLVKKNNSYTITSITNLNNINTFRNEIAPPLIDINATTGFYSMQIGATAVVYSGRTITWPSPTFFMDGTVFYEDNKKPVQYAQLRSVEDSVYAGEDGFYSLALNKNHSHQVIASKDSSKTTVTGSIAQGNILQKNIYLPYPEEMIISSLPKDRKIKIALYNLVPITTTWHISGNITQSLTNNLEKHQQLTVFASKKLQDELRDKKLKTFCNSAKCALASGKSLAVDYVLIGSVTEIEEKYKKILGKDEGNQYLLEKSKKSYYVIVLDIYNVELNKKITRLRINTKAPYINKTTQLLYKKLLHIIK